MKNMKDRIFFSLLWFAILLAGFFSVVKISNAESAGEEGITKEYYEEIKNFRVSDNYTAPPSTSDGYVFAGWYKDAELKTPLDETTQGGPAYAKFVPDYVLSVKAQVNQTALEDRITNTDRATLRLVTSVDSLKFEKVGFILQRSDWPGKKKDTGAENVFSTISYTDSVDGTWTKATPGEIFGECSDYFVTYNFINIPATAVNVEVTATPYWVTLDGTRVEGTHSVKTVNKGRSWIYVDAATNADGYLYGTKDHPYTDITTALQDILLKSGGKIFVLNDMEIKEKTDIEKIVTVQSNDTTNPVTLYGTVNSYMFDVKSTGTLGLSYITIDGRSEAIAASEGETNRTLQMISNEGTIIADNTTIQYGNSNYSGGAVWNKGELKATNCKFNNNVVTSDTANTTLRGGAIYNIASATAEIEDTSFQNNEVSTTAAGTNVYGGAIYSNGSLTVTDCQFVENTSTTSASSNTAAHGGAVYVDGADAVATFEKNDGEAHFSGNTATNWGGAIVLSNTALNNVTIDGYTFKEANSAGNGGAVYLAGAGAKLDGATFSANTTTGGGGAIFAKASSTLEIANSTLESNTAGSRGGAVYANASAVTLSGTTKFSSNSVTGGELTGGAVYATEVTLNIEESSDVTFANNSSAGTGGALHLNKVTTNMKAKATFSGNTALNGGAVYVEGSVATTINAGAVFSGNTATQSGGALYVTTAPMTITEAEFSENTAINGGAVYVEGTATTTINAGAVFSGNTATQSGGALYVTTAPVAITGAKFSENQASNATSTVYGGAMYIDKSTDVTIADTLFEGNTAQTSTAEIYAYGGAIFSKGNLTATDCQFATNKTITDGQYAHGGAVYIDGSNLAEGETAPVTQFIRDDGKAYFKGNTASNRGGAIVAVGTGSDDVNDVTIQGYTFDEVNSAKNGGAVYLTNVDAAITGAAFSQNQVSSDTSLVCGGAMYIDKNTDVTIADTLFEGNTAQTSTADIYAYGGAIFSKGELTATDCQFKTNTSKTTITDGQYAHGGAVYIDGVYLEGGESLAEGETAPVTKFIRDDGEAYFTGNTSLKWGGAITAHGYSTVLIQGYTFAGGNKAYDGGAVYLREAETTITGATFTDNVAIGVSSIPDEGGGGAVYAKNILNLQVIDSTFGTNKAYSKGGAIYLYDAGVTLSGATRFNGNSAYGPEGIGGAFYAISTSKSHEVDAGSNVQFSQNTAINGGAMYIDTGTTVTLTGTVFDGNSVSPYDGNDNPSGGAVYSKWSLTATDCQFKNNTSTLHGGAVTINGANAVATFTKTENGTAIFQGNTSTEWAGAVLLSGTTLDKVSIDGYTFDGNSARNGGAVRLEGGGSGATINNAVFTNNTATGGGGAVFAQGTSPDGTTIIPATIQINHGTFTGNTGSTRGGAVYLNCADATFTGTFTFSGNSSSSGADIFNINTTLVLPEGLNISVKTDNE